MGKRNKLRGHKRVLRPWDLTIHHRCPKSRNRKNKNNIPENRVWVRHDHHQAWHVLFQNFGAKLIAVKFDSYYNSFGWRIEKGFPIPGNETNMEKAWRLLFGGKCLEQILFEINNTWLDPRFFLVSQAITQVSTVAKVKT